MYDVFRWRNWIVRTIFSLMMISSFSFVVYLGPVALVTLVSNSVSCLAYYDSLLPAVQLYVTAWILAVSIAHTMIYSLVQQTKKKRKIKQGKTTYEVGM